MCEALVWSSAIIHAYSLRPPTYFRLLLIITYVLHQYSETNCASASARLWFKENGMMPNPKKYQAIVLGKKGCDINFQCANETIPTSNEINLLGVTLDSKLKFDAHVASVCRR